MPTRAWSPARYPEVSSGYQAKFDRAAAQLGIAGRELCLSVPSLGETRITCRHLGPALPPPRGALLWRICDPRRRGWLVLDSLSCLAVVSATLGLDGPKIGPRIDRLPTRIEAGIVAASLAAVVRAASRHLALDLDDDSWVDDDLVALELQLECESFDIRVTAQVPVEWIPPCPDAAIAADAIRRQLRISLPLELATTTLTMGDWSRAIAGDAVVFDGWAAPPRAGPWSLRVRCGERVAEATWNDAGQICLRSELATDEAAAPRADGRASAPGATERQMDRQMDQMGGTRRMANDAPMGKFSMLAAAPLEVIAEVGELVLRADEVMALQCGSVIPLKRARTRLVALKIGGKLWARGELVEVDGEMAVRLTELMTADDGLTAAASSPADP